MKIVKTDIEERIAGLAMVIGQSPASLQGWTCLFIACQDGDGRADMQSLLCYIRPILDSYLAQVDGNVYCCDNGSMHIICRGVPDNALEEIAHHITRFLQEEEGVSVEFKLYHLDTDGMQYIKRIVNTYTEAVPSGMLQDVAEFTQSDAYSRIVQDTQKDYSSIHLGDQYRPQVLLVDDDKVTRWMVENIVKDQCHFSIC